MKDEVRNFLLATLQSSFGIEPRKALAAQSLFDLGLDSFGFMEVVTALEVKFGILFESGELLSNDFKTIEGIVTLVEKRK